MYDTESRQAALAIEGVNGETEDDIVELLLKTLGKGEILPYGIGNIMSHRVGQIRCPTPGHWYAALPDGPTSDFWRNSPEHCVW